MGVGFFLLYFFCFALYFIANMKTIEAADECEIPKNPDKWCRIKDLEYYFPCKSKQCSKPFKECFKGSCRSCALRYEPCSETVPCCDSRMRKSDSVDKATNPTICSNGTCNPCYKAATNCKVDTNVTPNQRQVCCPSTNKPTLACRGRGPLSTSQCLEDPCAVSPQKLLKNFVIPGFQGGVSRCDGPLKEEGTDYDYACAGVNNQVCTRCLAYDAKCSPSGEKCCDYLSCDGKKCVRGPACSPLRFICTKNEDCCDNKEKGIKCKPGKQGKSYCQ